MFNFGERLDHNKLARRGPAGTAIAPHWIGKSQVAQARSGTEGRMAIFTIHGIANSARFSTASMSNVSRALSQLVSGNRIFSAAEDPAGLVISEQLRSQIGSLNKEIDNLSSSIGKYSAVGSSMDEMHQQLDQMRSLAVAAANEGGNSASVQAAYADAGKDILAQYNNTIATAEYNGQKTLNGSEGSLADISKLTKVDLSSPEAARASIEEIDSAAHELEMAQIKLGSTQRDELESQRSQLEVTKENLVASESTIRDTEFGATYSDYVANMIRSQVGIALSAHAGLMSTNVLKLFQS
jgi:flagellin